MSKTKHTPTPTIITLTLPETDGDGTLLVQRGDLAHMSQFAHTPETDFTILIQQALAALATVETDPPVIPDTPPRKTTTKSVAPIEPPEAMIDIPRKSKKRPTQIPARLVRITGGETDNAAQQQALKVAGRLLDSELWDGKISIGIDDAPAVLRRLNGLSDRELNVLFKLEQFVQINPNAAEDNADTPQDDPTDDDQTPDNQAVEGDQDAAEVLDVSNTADQPGLI
ncbi:MAG: hypothetical protein GX573_27710 [Chloroflexi bacterium]|nr:hypothetical protein [Chloroflexota bacterium]HMN12868.1 hypothetical protein [Bellilinea sp.]